MRPNFGTAPHDPSANTLVQGLGPNYSLKANRTSIVGTSTAPPANTAALPGHLQLHMIMVPQDLHMLNLGDHQSRELIDLIGRQKYSYIDPALRLHCNRPKDEIKHNAQRVTDEALTRVLGIQPGTDHGTRFLGRTVLRRIRVPHHRTGARWSHGCSPRNGEIHSSFRQWRGRRP
jgi:hypothetical protein